MLGDVFFVHCSVFRAFIPNSLLETTRCPLFMADYYRRFPRVPVILELIDLVPQTAVK